MKGDFSRLTFDPRKHYNSVRMQQGRVQLDADWNEQAEILLYLLRESLQDILGRGATDASAPGFVIRLDTPADSKRLPDFNIGTGHFYVEGILCENETPVKFSQQADYPGAKTELNAASDHDAYLVYLDGWERHITTAEDPSIREVALGGPDTSTRVKTVWQVKLLPLPSKAVADKNWREQGGLLFAGCVESLRSRQMPERSISSPHGSEQRAAFREPPVPG